MNYTYNELVEVLSKYSIEQGLYWLDIYARNRFIYPKQQISVPYQAPEYPPMEYEIAFIADVLLRHGARKSEYSFDLKDISFWTHIYRSMTQVVLTEKDSEGRDTGAYNFFLRSGYEQWRLRKVVPFHDLSRFFMYVYGTEV